MKKTIRIKMSATPGSNGNIRIKTSVTRGGSTRTKTQTIRMK